MTPLRLGFLLSGLLHVAVVAAFSLTWEQDIPAVDESRPLTLNLALFKPAQAAPAPPVPLEEPQGERKPQQVAEEPPPPQPPERQKKITPAVEPRPTPVVKRVAPKAPAKPRPVVRRVKDPKPVTKKRTQAKPVEATRIASPSVALASVTEPQPVASAAELQEKQHYLAALAAKINRSKYYPFGSRRRGEEGKVVVRFVVQKNGDLTDLTIVESSGSRRLDAAALKTLRRVAPFRPIPEALNRDHWPISVPIAFSLSG
jgi:protein TonB